MTRKHFEAIAITLGYQLRQYPTNGAEYNAIVQTAAALCRDFAAANSAFYGDRFMAFMYDVAEGRRDLDGKKVAA